MNKYLFIIFALCVLIILLVFYKKIYENIEDFYIQERPSSRTFYPGKYFPIPPVFPTYEDQTHYPSYFTNWTTYFY